MYQPSDFTVALDNAKFSIIYHNTTKSYNVSQINDYIFSTSLDNYNIIMTSNISKKQKSKLKRPVKLNLSKYKEAYDMKNAPAKYRGIYMSDLKVVEQILDTHYQQYPNNETNTFRYFIKYVDYLSLDVFMEFGLKNKSMHDELDEIAECKANFIRSIITKSNIQMMKGYVISLYDLGVMYNDNIDEMIDDCNAIVKCIHCHKVDTDEIRKINNQLTNIKFNYGYDNVKSNYDLYEQMNIQFGIFCKLLKIISDIVPKVCKLVKEYTHFGKDLVSQSDLCVHETNEFNKKHRKTSFYLSELLNKYQKGYVKRYNTIIDNVKKVHNLNCNIDMLVEKYKREDEYSELCTTIFANLNNFN